MQIRPVAEGPNRRFVIYTSHLERRDGIVPVHVDDHVLVTQHDTPDEQDFYLFCHLCKSRNCKHAVAVFEEFYRSV